MKEIEEAKIWLRSARRAYDDGSSGRERFTVAVAQAIHALVRANDALTMTYLNRRATRHEDAPRLFGDLVRQNKIPAQHAKLRKLLVEAMSEKSSFDYRGEEVGAKKASRWLRRVEMFIAAVEEMLTRKE